MVGPSITIIKSLLEIVTFNWSFVDLLPEADSERAFFQYQLSVSLPYKTRSALNLTALESTISDLTTREADVVTEIKVAVTLLNGQGLMVGVEGS